MTSTASRAGGTRQRGKAWWPIALPSLLVVGVFFVLPFLLNIRFAFSSWTSFSDVITWNGFENFRLLIDQGIFVGAVVRTLIYAVITMVVINVVSLPLALALQRTTTVNGIFRSLFFLPVLISPVAAGFIWYALLTPNGPINQAIGLIWPGFEYAWFGHPTSALIGVAFVDAWKWSGVVTLVYIAGLNSVPAALLEAARLDGASAWQSFRRIVVPLLAPAFTFNVVVSLVGALSAYDIPIAVTRGGPGFATTVLNVALYQQWASGFLGSGSALSLTVTVLVIVIAVPLIAYLRSREVEA